MDKGSLARDTSRLAAFTIFELMVAITVMGIMTIMGIGLAASTQRFSRDEQRRTKVSEAVTAITKYYRDQAKYPSETNGTLRWQADGLYLNDKQEVTLTGTNSYSATGTTANSTQYKYVRNLSGFIVCARLESNIWYKMGPGNVECQ